MLYYANCSLEPESPSNPKGRDQLIENVCMCEWVTFDFAVRLATATAVDDQTSLNTQTYIISTLDSFDSGLAVCGASFIQRIASI